MSGTDPRRGESPARNGVARDGMEIVGYADRWTVRPGERIEFKVSTREAGYDVRFVRLLQGDDSRDGPGARETPAAFPLPGRQPGREQRIGTGSYVRVEPVDDLGSVPGVTVTAWIQPTTPAKPDQGIVSTLSATDDAAGGFALLLGEGHVRMAVGDRSGAVHEAVSDTALIPAAWHFVAGSYDRESGTIRVFQWARDRWPVAEASGHGEVVAPLEQDGPTGPGRGLVVGAAWADRAGREPGGPGHFNGRIEDPTVYDRALSEDELLEAISGRQPVAPLLGLDFTAWRPSRLARDGGPRGHHGTVANNPARAVRGHRWDGSVHDASARPSHYGAIHFHDDDVADAGWETDFAITIPIGTQSGVYAARLGAGDGPDAEDAIPFVVAPPTGGRHSATAFILPTLSYLAYGNEHFHDVAFVDWSKASDRPLELSRQDRYIAAHRELGPSLYDLHSDGSISTYVSRLRPIVNFRPGIRAYWNGAARHFGADLYLVDFLEREGIAHDVLTDEDLHHEGLDLIGGYRVVILGSHPEYVTGPMRQALVGYLEAGGRLLYLGGNGLYWVSSLDPDRPYILEVRKSDLTFATPGLGVPPGEAYHSTTGERGGTWKERGLPAEAVLGVGYAAQGFATGRPFQRRPASHAPAFAWMFDGVEGEVIGDFGIALGGGAAGDEFDRADVAQGSPAHTRVLASSSGHDRFTLQFGLAYDFDQTLADHTRADIAYLEYPNGGAVFAAGSMSWMPSLPHNGYRNDVATITRNVLARFLGDVP